MITIVVGRPGQGKTLYGVDRVFEGLSSKSTFVATNVQVQFDKNDPRAKRYKYLSPAQTIQEILTLDLHHLFREKKFRRVLLVIDEVQTIMNSRRWEDLPPEFEFFLQQHRHFHVDMIGLTQSVKRADTVMRELVQFFFKLEKIFTVRTLLGSFGFFFVWEYDPDSIESADGQYQKVGMGFPRLFFASPFIMKAYDTYQEFPSLAKEGKKEIREYVYTKKETIVPLLVTKKMLDL